MYNGAPFAPETSLATSLKKLGALLEQQDKVAEALDVFKHSLAIWEELGNEHNQAALLDKIDDLLKKQGKRDVIQIASKDKPVLLQQESQNKRVPGSMTDTTIGYIKGIFRQGSGYIYGFIVPFDGSEDVYFGEDKVDEEVIPKLAEGLLVWVEVEMGSQGPRARHVWLKESP